MKNAEYEHIKDQLNLTANQEKIIGEIYKNQFNIQQTLVKEANAKLRIINAADSLREPNLSNLDTEAIEKAKTLSKEEIEQLRNEWQDIQTQMEKAHNSDSEKIRSLLTLGQIRIWYTYKLCSTAYLIFENDFDDIPKETISKMCSEAVCRFLNSPKQTETTFKEAYLDVDQQIKKKLTEINAQKITITKQWIANGKKVLPVLKQKLKSGTPKEKEEVLNIFMEEHIAALIPDVIEAILDNTASLRHLDTGWGNIYHQAATALCEFAYRIDGLTQEKRGIKEYSFYNDVGTADEKRRKEVYNNWLQWWDKNKSQQDDSKQKDSSDQSDKDKTKDDKPDSGEKGNK
ncbi:MAG: hypothetical protein V1701_04580 [Planctomycetota bacterium]